MAISLAATLVTLLLPPVVLGTRLPREKDVRQLLGYFACIGVGYILIQVSLIQKFVLLLGHPTYALTVIIFSMLVFSGLGSFMSRRITGESEQGLLRALIAAAICVAAVGVAAPFLSHAGASWPLLARGGAIALLIAAVVWANGD